MTISNQKKIDYLWKKVGYNVTKTDDITRKSASNESIPSPNIIRGDSIWVESNLIPNSIPLQSSLYVEVRSDYLANTIECYMDNTSTPLRTWKTGLSDWIPTEFGPTYQIKVYVDNPGSLEPQSTGIRLFPDGINNDEWFFDYSSGVLHFIGDSLPSVLTPQKTIYIVGARYIGTKGIQDFQVNESSVNAVQGELPASQTFTANGATISFSLTHNPASVHAIDVYVEDVLQRPEEVYTVQNSNLIFTSVPPSGTDIYVKYRYPFASVVDMPDNSVKNEHLHLNYTSNQYNGDGSQLTYGIEHGHTEHDILVIKNGLILPPQEYNVSGTVLTLNVPPSLGDVIDIRYLPV
jgi:phenolic acid decarboxylase